MIRKPDASASVQEIIEHCRSQIAFYKKPKEVVFAESLPKKGFAIDYEALDRAYGGGG